MEWLSFTERDGSHPGSFESEGESADTGKEVEDIQAAPLKIEFCLLSEHFVNDRENDGQRRFMFAVTLDEAGRPIVEVVAKIMRPMSTMLGAQQLVAMATKTGSASAIEH